MKIRPIAFIILIVLQLMFISLKLDGNTEVSVWSWWMVFSPVLFPVAVVAGMVILAVIAHLIFKTKD